VLSFGSARGLGAAAELQGVFTQSQIEGTRNGDPMYKDKHRPEQVKRRQLLR
jgi:hypothetical protein